jgi:hypothetical protein
MPTQDTSIIKNKIVNFLENNGPSLPIHISKNIDSSYLFTSAFLSELLYEKRIKTTTMKVGSSSVFYLPGQEASLEKFAQQFLKSKEKEAYELLHQIKFLEDSEQQPAIRVALRAIKDFAIPIEKDGRILWRYFTADEKELLIKKEIPKKEEPKVETILKPEIKLEKNEPHKKKEKITKSKLTEKKNTKSNKDENFFNKIKEYLSKNNTEIEDIELFTKDSLILKIKKSGKASLLVAYNKKKIIEEDILKAHKKSQELGLEYSIFSFGEPSKKILNLIEASKRLSEIRKID